MIKDIQAKTLLARLKGHDDWFGLYYNMNLYRGCQHQCIYCDSRAECYQIEDFDHEVLVKSNAASLLRRELAGKRTLGTIGTGSMNDPYMPLELDYRLTRSALEVIAEAGFPVHIITKSDIVLRDLDLLVEISQKTYAAVSFTITSTDDLLSRKLEPGAPPASRRLAALQAVRQRGLLAGVTLMPVLPFIADTPKDLYQVVNKSASHGAAYLLPAFGMTLRDRQREYFYRKLDGLFPGMRDQYTRTFGGRYHAPAREAERLQSEVADLCSRLDLPMKMPFFTPRRRLPAEDLQPRLF